MFDFLIQIYIFQDESIFAAGSHRLLGNESSWEHQFNSQQHLGVFLHQQLMNGESLFQRVNIYDDAIFHFSQEFLRSSSAIFILSLLFFIFFGETTDKICFLQSMVSLYVWLTSFITFLIFYKQLISLVSRLVQYVL